MKRGDLISHLVREGCVFIREGARHSVFFNPFTRRTSTVPRHTEVNDFLARKICRDLGVDNVRKK
ncbi:addiction module toxin, HicA family [Candidatus Azambacteria bacterium RIFCSPHIGHO2_02_FULL_52_12]|uniref:Addiction module toxin, HicA family n=1 Tax=Candidatus Azambacteria bacterium RIFCSPLOWO2_01_FULL_46_25 TaxID=1797298 RepID=A0A1F5BTG3_9BACT|nr:MAG: addiction module toxin, HicA family [Candidatus Azambacteria bacterium RIFCSPHIGHO2_02_FULL_52_12]OGD33898.1 MAG: addiction module toxin, HicA family [Candidatus Azambacteria bacterium RIFCSPLOWO2_01_FULL_46_25]OGD37157.1 MAG: addiction module toxin, HicA family [Candidatus Azambacteria bacterium RIFCSPHIGHO2_01_FULL_51_74]